MKMYYILPKIQKFEVKERKKERNDSYGQGTITRP
jgi:hypothetical protein